MINRVTPGKIILGELGGIETGIRQLIRRTPLETVRIALPSGAVAAEITRLQAASRMSRAEFASVLGTSVSRLSTYLSGTVTPSAALLVRMRRVAASTASPRWVCRQCRPSDADGGVKSNDERDRS